MTSRRRLLVTRRLPQAVEARLAADYDATFNTDDNPMSAGALAQAAASYDALMPTITDKITAEVIGAGAGRLKAIANYGAGFEHIDLDAAKAAGIVVTNTPGALTEATADIALTLILMAARRAGEGERELRAGRWSGWRPTHLLGQSLAGKTLGLVGFGRIAQATARRAKEGFGMKIAYHGRRRAEAEVEARFGAAHYADLAELLAASDVVSLHCPGGPATRHLINAGALARMKPTSILINTARGSVVDEAALATALEKGRIAAAGLDVYEAEPAVHPALLALENAVLLPHLGSATIESRTAMGMQAADNLDAVLAGREPADRIA
jgi:lactate dehydrogenase-like 2-hydroxyacid dehydrogenase